MILSRINKMVSWQSDSVIRWGWDWLVHTGHRMLFFEKCSYLAVCQSTIWGNWKSIEYLVLYKVKGMGAKLQLYSYSDLLHNAD